MRFKFRSALPSVFVLFLMSCAPQASVSSSPAFITFERPGDPATGDAAMLRGRVESVNGCLVINDDRIPRRRSLAALAVTPTTIAGGDYPFINIGDNASIAIGSHIALGGGGGNAFGDDGEIREGFYVPPQCLPLLELQEGWVFLAFSEESVD